MSDPSITSSWSNLRKRLVTGLIMTALAGIFLWIGGWILIIALAFIVVQMNREWNNMRPSGSITWRIGGLLYSVLPCLSLIVMRNLEFRMNEIASFTATLYPIAMVIATDTGAYFTGRTLGGPKLAPSISPKKTWSGLIGGVLCSIAVAVLMQPWVPWPENLLLAALLGALIALLGQAGDLVESWVKRKNNIKDSGSLLPGHGGVLDRMDGYVFVLPLYLLLLCLYADLLP